MVSPSFGYEYTTVIDCNTYVSDGICQGFKARRSIYEHKAVEASLLCRTELDHAVGGLKLEDTVTYENPSHGHSVALMMPLTLPDRIELLGYISEYFCLYDDEEDYGNVSATVAAERKVAQKQLLKQLLGRFIAVDPKQGKAIVDAFVAYGVMATSLDKTQDFTTIQQYIDYRYDDYGSEFLLACTMFGAGIDPLTLEERALVDPLVQLGFRHISLLNDMYSFDVEYASTEDQSRIVNGVYILSKLHRISIEQAKDRLRSIVIGIDQQFSQLWNEATRGGTFSNKLQHVVATIAQQMVGKVVWGSSCLRYNLQYRVANRANRKRTDSGTGDAAILDTLVSERQRRDSLLLSSTKGSASMVTVTTTEITTAS